MSEGIKQSPKSKKLHSEIMGAVAIFITVLSACSSPPATQPPVPTEVLVTQSPPTMIPTTVTPAFTPTFTPTKTPIPIPGDFELEADAKSWGNTPDIDNVHIKEGVTQDCDNGYKSKCSLMYQPTINDNTIAKNNYVARYTSNKDHKSLISIFVYVPEDVDLCLPNSGGCSTARVIVWDKNGAPHEGEALKLTDQGQWREITLDLRGTSYSEPYRAVGVHFYLVNQTIYTGTFHIDTVTVTQP